MSTARDTKPATLHGDNPEQQTAQGNTIKATEKASTQAPSSTEDDKEWEKVEYKETVEDRVPTDASTGHFDIKIGTKRWNKTLFSVDWNSRTYEDEPGDIDDSKK